MDATALLFIYFAFGTVFAAAAHTFDEQHRNRIEPLGFGQQLLTLLLFVFFWPVLFALAAFVVIFGKEPR
jgi:hypothetical protein